MPRDGTATREKVLDAAQQLVLDRGFAATSVDAVLAEAGVTKGAFFHHFRSKNALGRALLERYAAADARTLDWFMAEAERVADDPAEQVVAFARLFEVAAGDLPQLQPGCLFVSFIYERELAGEDSDALIAHSIGLWRERLLAKLETATRTQPLAAEVNLPSLADQFFTIFEGGFVLARATKDTTALRAQLAQLRQYLELLFGVQAPEAASEVDLAALNA